MGEARTSSRKLMEGNKEKIMEYVDSKLIFIPLAYYNYVYRYYEYNVN